MLHQFQPSFTIYKGPKAFLLGGTSSSGKTTTAGDLKTQLELKGAKASILSYDDFVIFYQSEFYEYIDQELRVEGFTDGLQGTMEKASILDETELEHFEQSVERIGTPWMQQQLALSAKKEILDGRVVIIDTLDTHDIVRRLKELDIDTEVVNILLMIPVSEFPERIHQRNIQAIEKYKVNKSGKDYKNCRDPFDMIEQYIQFFYFEPQLTESIDSLSGYDIKAILSTAYEHTKEMLHNLTEINCNHALSLNELDQEKQKKKFLQRADDCESELQILKLQQETAVDKLVKKFIGENIEQNFVCKPLKKYNIIINTNKIEPADIGNFILSTTHNADNLSKEKMDKKFFCS